MEEHLGQVSYACHVFMLFVFFPRHLLLTVSPLPEAWIVGLLLYSWCRGLLILMLQIIFASFLFGQLIQMNNNKKISL